MSEADTGKPTPEEWERLRDSIQVLALTATPNNLDEASLSHFMDVLIENAMAALPLCISSSNLFRFFHGCVFPLAAQAAQKHGYTVVPAAWRSVIHGGAVLNHIGRWQSRIRREEEKRLPAADQINLRLARAVEERNRLAQRDIGPSAQDMVSMAMRTQKRKAETAQVQAGSAQPQIQIVPNGTHPRRKTGPSKGLEVNAVAFKNFRGSHTQEIFAEACAVSVATIQRAEAGKRVGRKTLESIIQRADKKLKRHSNLDDILVTSHEPQN